MKIKTFGVVVTTQDKLYEVSRLIDSIERSNGAYQFKIVFINQTGKAFFKETTLNLQVINTQKISLSTARNIALEHLLADCYCFPDDDCIYYEDTFVRVDEAFQAINQPALVIGAIYDRLADACYGSKQTKDSSALSLYNFYSFVSSVTIFSANRILFDDSLGVGSKFGSCEDAKYVYDCFQFGNVQYCNEIHVWHPLHSPVSRERVIKYGLGYGAFCRKLSNHLGLYYLTLGLLYCLFSMIKSIGDGNLIRNYSCSLVSRIKGYLHAC